MGGPQVYLDPSNNREDESAKWFATGANIIQFAQDYKLRKQKQDFDENQQQFVNELKVASTLADEAGVRLIDYVRSNKVVGDSLMKRLGFDETQTKDFLKALEERDATDADVAQEQRYLGPTGQNTQNITRPTVEEGEMEPQKPTASGEVPVKAPTFAPEETPQAPQGPMTPPGEFPLPTYDVSPRWGGGETPQSHYQTFDQGGGTLETTPQVRGSVAPILQAGADARAKQQKTAEAGVQKRSLGFESWAQSTGRKFEPGTFGEIQAKNDYAEYVRNRETAPLPPLPGMGKDGGSSPEMKKTLPGGEAPEQEVTTVEAELEAHMQKKAETPTPGMVQATEATKNLAREMPEEVVTRKDTKRDLYQLAAIEADVIDELDRSLTEGRSAHTIERIKKVGEIQNNLYKKGKMSVKDLESLRSLGPEGRAFQKELLLSKVNDPAYRAGLALVDPTLAGQIDTLQRENSEAWGKLISATTKAEERAALLEFDNRRVRAEAAEAAAKFAAQNGGGAGGVGSEQDNKVFLAVLEDSSRILQETMKKYKPGDQAMFADPAVRAALDNVNKLRKQRGFPEIDMPELAQNPGILGNIKNLLQGVVGGGYSPKGADPAAGGGASPAPTAPSPVTGTEQTLYSEYGL